MSDAQSEQQARQWLSSRPVDRRDQGIGTLLSEAFELGQSVGRERVQVGNVADESFLDELLHAGVRKAVNVHRRTRSEMHDRFEPTPGAVVVLAEQVLLVHPHGCGALGTVRRDRCRWRRRCRVAFLGHGSDDLRNHVAGSLDLHEVADAEVLLPNELEIVKGRKAHSRAPNLHRFEFGVRVDLPGPTNIDLDRDKTRLCDVGGKFASDRPPRFAPADFTELSLHGRGLDLNDHPVDSEVEFGAKRMFDLMRVLVHFGHCCAATAVRRSRHSPRGEYLQELGLSAEHRAAAGDHHRVSEEPERTSGCFGRVELTERAGRRVSGVRKHRFVILGTLSVQPLEGRKREVHLAANLHTLRVPRAVQPERDVTHRAQVCRDNLADAPVSTRGAECENTAFVREAHRRAVDLEFGRVAGAVDGRTGHPHSAFVPCLHFGVVKCVGERSHGH